MQLTYELISPQELTKTEKILLACKGEDFCCIRHNGVVKINKALPNPEAVVEIAGAMWQFGRLLDCAEAERMDNLWEQLRQIAGEVAANQIYAAWSEALREKLDAEEKSAAAEWLQGRNIPDELDAICDTIGTHLPGFIKALWSQTTSTDAIFLYGYQTGMDAVRKAGFSIGRHPHSDLPRRTGNKSC